MLAVLGYIPGFACALFMYQIARDATLLPVFMSSYRAIMVLILTILMCFISGAIAIRKLRSADPADMTYGCNDSWSLPQRSQALWLCQGPCGSASRRGQGAQRE